MKRLLLRALTCLFFVLPALASAQVVHPTFLLNGAGAVARTYQDKAADAISVKDFGAIGNGVADDTAAFNAAVTYARANNQLAGHIPRGAYRISSPLNVSGISMRGEGAIASKLIAANNFTGTHMLLLDAATSGGASDAVYSDLWLYGSRKTIGTNVGGIKISGDVLGNTFLRIRMAEMKGAFIDTVVGHPGGSAISTVNQFIGVRMIGGDSYGVHLNGAQQFKFIGALVTYIGNHAFFIEGPSSEIDIDSSYLEHIGQPDTGAPFNSNVDGIHINRADNIRIARNRIQSYGSMVSHSGNGINLISCRFCEVDGNTISGNEPSGIGHRQIAIGGGARNRLTRLQLNAGVADISITAANDVIVNSPYTAQIATKMPIFTSNQIVIPSGTSYHLTPSSGVTMLNSDHARARLPSRATAAGFYARSATPPGATNRYVVTVLKNGVATALTLTLTNANLADANDNTHEVVFEAGDYLSFRVVSTGADIPIGQMQISLGLLM